MSGTFIQTVVNLAEQHGKEAQVTCAYRDFAVELDWADVAYHEYDFHKETKGMKYILPFPFVKQVLRQRHPDTRTLRISSRKWSEPLSNKATSGSLMAA
jgi:hypothetical protein